MQLFLKRRGSWHVLHLGELEALQVDDSRLSSCSCVSAEIDFLQIGFRGVLRRFQIGSGLVDRSQKKIKFTVIGCPRPWTETVCPRARSRAPRLGASGTSAVGRPIAWDRAARAVTRLERLQVGIDIRSPRDLILVELIGSSQGKKNRKVWISSVRVVSGKKGKYKKRRKAPDWIGQHVVEKKIGIRTYWSLLRFGAEYIGCLYVAILRNF
jgi:hypothetical protein